MLTAAAVMSLTLVAGLVLAQSDPLTDSFELGDGVDPLVPGVGDVAGDGLQPGPDWGDLFEADRSPKDVFDELGNAGANGVPDFLDTFGSLRLRRDGGFLLDDISAGSAVDGTVFLEDGSIGSGPVLSVHDLGNAYAYSQFDGQRDLVLYAGVERLSGGAGSMVFEFTRKLFSLGGAGEIVGTRSTGDLKIEATFAAAGLQSLEVSQWKEVQLGVFDWSLIETLPIDPVDPVEQCNAAGSFCAVCNGSGVYGGAWPNYDAAGNPITDLAPNTFMEFGINLTALLGVHTWDNYYGTRYSSIQISTFDDAATPVAQDYVQGSFVRASKLAR